MAEEEKKKLSPLTLAAGAGASILSMVIGSFFKTAGTIAGAAIASVTYSVGAFWFEDRARRAHAKVAARRHQGKDASSYEHLEDLPLERSLVHAETSSALIRDWGLRKRLGVSAGILAVCLASAVSVLFIIESATGKTLSTNLGRDHEYGTTLGGHSTVSPRPIVSPSSIPSTATPSVTTSVSPSQTPSQTITPSPFTTPSATYTGVSSGQ